jgi:hypothetical protein
VSILIIPYALDGCRDPNTYTVVSAKICESPIRDPLLHRQSDGFRLVSAPRSHIFRESKILSRANADDITLHARHRMATVRPENIYLALAPGWLEVMQFFFWPSVLHVTGLFAGADSVGMSIYRGWV